jgi:hypothetical protein
VGVVDLLSEVLALTKHQVMVAFVYGSVATSERSASDIDLMMIG